jgi:pimeloyl-ACP methyl ester carboxylesterase
MNTSVANSEKCIRLRDGRSLGYAEFGSPTGYPIFLFNGSVSRLFYPLDDTVAISANARIITVERPGIGLSTFKPNRTTLDWPTDINLQLQAHQQVAPMLLLALSNCPIA